MTTNKDVLGVKHVLTTTKAAKEWGCNRDWVSNRCREKMIPGASQEGKGKSWYIPDDAEKPPCTGSEAVSILENLLEISQGNSVNLFPPKSIDRGKQILTYLENYSYITIVQQKDYDSSLIQTVSIVTRGFDLICAVRREIESKEEIVKRYGFSVGLNLGVISGNLAIEQQKTKSN